MQTCKKEVNNNLISTHFIQSILQDLPNILNDTNYHLHHPFDNPIMVTIQPIQHIFTNIFHRVHNYINLGVIIISFCWILQALFL